MHPLIVKAAQLLKSCAVCQVASVTADGYPRVCILAPLRSAGVKRFWFSTGASGHKVADFRRSGKAGVTFYHGGDSVTLTGTMKIVTDAAVKKALWSDNLAPHFPNGGAEDPEYCILEFTALEGTFYIDGAFETMPV